MKEENVVKTLEDACKLLGVNNVMKKMGCTRAHLWNVVHGKYKKDVWAERRRLVKVLVSLDILHISKDFYQNITELITY